MGECRRYTHGKAWAQKRPEKTLSLHFRLIPSIGTPYINIKKKKNENTNRRETLTYRVAAL